MMMKPAVPKPTAEYMAAKRAECKKASPCDDDEAKEAMREQAPFWMSQASIAYNVPNDGIDKDHPSIDKIPGGGQTVSGSYEYNNVNFDDSPVKYVNTMNHGGGLKAAGKYLAMGSFFNNSRNDPPKNELDLSKHHQVVGRYFLVEVKEDFLIPNPDSCLDKDGTLFAPAGSFILAFSGTEVDAQALGLLKQDFDWQPGPLPSLQVGPPYVPCPPPAAQTGIEGYCKMIEAQKTMFEGTGPCTNNYMALETKAGFVDHETKTVVPGKQITIVGHSLGGAHAQLAAVQIALTYKAKVRVITFESILAFTPEGAQKVVDDFIVGPDGIPDISGKAKPTLNFPAEAGKITAQRWVEDDSPMTAAPLGFPAGLFCPIPILNIFNPLSWCFGPRACSGTWKDKYRLVGCWPCNGNLGNGYISRALIISGFQAGRGTPSRGMFGCCPKGGGRLCRRGPKDTLVYSDDEFALDISDERDYVTKGALQLRWPGTFCCVKASATNHFQPFLHWMLYKGAYQNKDAPNSRPPRSQYVPKVVKKDNNPCPPPQ